MRELRGMPVVNALAEKFSCDISRLRQSGIIPKLAVIRIGENEEDIAYEKGIKKRFSCANAIVDILILPSDVTQEKLENVITSLNDDASVHGILIFRPLPKHLSVDRIKKLINADKDVDCMGINNTAHLYAGDKHGYPPCTPQAVIELLEFYNIDIAGKKVVIVGRSLVVGKPLAMLLLGKNATVTICHTKTVNLADECKRADIIIACAGAAKMITADFTNPKQILIDVGINYNDGKLCGDADYEAVADKVEAITPVPGGVGMVTTSVLVKHTIQSAHKKAE